MSCGCDCCSSENQSAHLLRKRYQSFFNGKEYAVVRPWCLTRISLIFVAPQFLNRKLLALLCYFLEWLCRNVLSLQLWNSSTPTNLYAVVWLPVLRLKLSCNFLSSIQPTWNATPCNVALMCNVFRYASSSHSSFRKGVRSFSTIKEKKHNPPKKDYQSLKNKDSRK